MNRSLVITIISAENLSLHGKPVSSAFVGVRADDSDQQCASTSTTAKTAEEKATSNPQWNQKLPVELPSHARYITVEVRCKSWLSSNRLVGRARVPVSDFVGAYVPGNHVHFSSYRLRDGDGLRNGIVNISVKVLGAPASRYVAPMSRPELGVPVRTLERREEVVGMVAGVPVWFAQPCYSQKAQNRNGSC